MTKREQIDAVAHAADITPRQARDAIDALVASLAIGLLEHERVTLAGLGNFSIRQRRPRRVCNPATGVPMDLPASAAVVFTPTSELRERVRARWSRPE